MDKVQRDKEDFVRSWVNEIKDDESVTNLSESEPSNILNCSEIDSETTVSSTYVVELLKELEGISFGTADEADTVRLPTNIARIQNFISAEQLHELANRNFHGSDNIHIGPVINLKGAIYLARSDGEADPNQVFSSIGNFGGSSSSQSRATGLGFIQNPLITLDSSGGLKMVKRTSWLAQPPMIELEKLETPVRLVIIGHTATESSDRQAKNIFMVRTIQQVHVESREWNDIAYNFLIGCDGNIYEGRGFEIVGAHTYGYNYKAICISFIGTFMRMMPPEVSLQRCKDLIEYGVENGHIAPDYKLLGHCQCTTIESPGEMLFEEIKTWPHWSEAP